MKHRATDHCAIFPSLSFEEYKKVKRWNSLETGIGWKINASALFLLQRIANILKENPVRHAKERFEKAAGKNGFIRIVTPQE